MVCCGTSMGNYCLRGGSKPFLGVCDRFKMHHILSINLLYVTQFPNNWNWTAHWLVRERLQDGTPKHCKWCIVTQGEASNCSWYVLNLFVRAFDRFKQPHMLPTNLLVLLNSQTIGIEQLIFERKAVNKMALSSIENCVLWYNDGTVIAYEVLQNPY